MDSIASSSNSTLHHRIRPTQPVADRIFRALRHQLKLLHRTDTNFFVLGATGNVYTVTLSTNPSCTCPDRTSPCKHIYFVLIRVLGVSVHDTCLRRGTLRPCKVSLLISLPSSVHSLASVGIRETFHQLFYKVSDGGLLRPNNKNVEIKEGTVCPICLDEIEKNDEERVVSACRTCKNVVHEDCLKMWKKTRGRKGGNCVICRARWRDNRSDQERYLNLAAYVGDDVTAMYHTGIDGKCL
ncbi:uncharacterized protein LOC126660571 [Mercurialis annua]|uniref:uncharacterized protein LOC126660571 n=1 Tax=Mercurialis annua TaxID=3986 RepID=UPI00215FBCED|nr:uncharacterized protein LOC126660571 [Mercurialis annua]